MLTHKLADYYHLTHQFDPQVGSVRIFRTPFCRLPESLSSVSNPPTTGNTPPPVPTMKILRRGGDKDGSPSKPTSENGGEGQDKSKAAKERMSREEKEAHYHAARERIFGQADKSGEQTPGIWAHILPRSLKLLLTQIEDTEDGNGMSRSSSVSGKAKQPKTRRKHRNDSEPFDVRSAYTPIYPADPQQFAPWQSAPMLQQQFPAVTAYGQPKGYATPPMTGYMPQMTQMGQQQAYGAMPQQPAQGLGIPYQTQSPLSNSQSYYGSPVQQSPSRQHVGAWGAQGNQQFFQQYTPRAPNANPGGTIPYPYGQLPSTINPQDPKSQHPIPGSFNRHAFNPKTQSFVPGVALRGGDMQQQVGSNHSSPHMQQYNMYQPPQPQFMGYNMSRQSSNTSVPSSYHASPHLAQRPMMMQQQGMMGMQPQMQQPMIGSPMVGSPMQQQMGHMPMMNPQAQQMMQGPQMQPQQMQQPMMQGQMQPQMMSSPPMMGSPGPQNMMQNQMAGQQQMVTGQLATSISPPQGQFFGVGYMQSPQNQGGSSRPQ